MHTSLDWYTGMSLQQDTGYFTVFSEITQLIGLKVSPLWALGPLFINTLFSAGASNVYSKKWHLIITSFFKKALKIDNPKK